MQNQTLRFIVIDDNKLDCFIADKIIRFKGMHEHVLLFTEATKAIEFIANTPAPTSFSKTILILDIQMPIMNGFQFVEAFEKLPEKTRSDYVIFMISSSVNESDWDRVAGYSSVRKLMNKPFNKEVLDKIVAWATE